MSSARVTGLTGIAALLTGISTLVPIAHAQSTTEQSAGSAQIEEVVVTADRRSERLQDVPVAVSVISDQQLKSSNYSGITNLQYLVPSVQYNSYLGGGFQVRGVGTQTVNLSTEQDVGIVVDDVVQGVPQLTFATPSYQALTDIERVEALKGPQGTLFGKNSSVGVIQIITKRPDFNGFSADASVSYASGGEAKVFGNANIPISDTVAARLSAFEYHHAGIVNNLYNGDKLGGYDQYGVRGKVLWQPTDDLSVYMIAERIHTQDTGNGSWTIRSCGSGFGAFSACATDAPYGVVPGPDNRSVALDYPMPAKTDTTSGSVHVDYRIGNDTLTSVTAFLRMKSYENVDADFSPRPILSFDESIITGKQFTQEFRLASPADQFLEYTIGAFYYNVDSNYKNNLAGTYGFLPDNSPILLSNGFAGTASGGQTFLNSRTESFAFFGQATAHITNNFQLIGGLRFSRDAVSANVHVEEYPGICEFAYAFGGPCHSIALPSPVDKETTTESNLSGKVTAKYIFNDDVNAYVTFASGYKGPAISYAALEPLSPIKPETSKAYEIGLKSQWFDRRVVLNIDAFYEKYTNFQADTFVINAENPAASNFKAANAGGLVSKGVELEGTWLATDALTLNGSLSYNPTNYTDFVIQCLDSYTNPAVIGTCYTDPNTGTRLFNAKGYPLPQAPQWSYTVGANYVRPVANGFVMDASANWSWRSSTYSLVADPNSIQGGYGLLGVNLGIAPEEGRWHFSVFARNLLDRQFVSAIFPTFLDDGSLTGIAVPTRGYSNIPNIEARRHVGVRLDVSF